ncbi:hypothetical protein D3C71_740990 [compost metagenome]
MIGPNNRRAALEGIIAVQRQLTVGIGSAAAHRQFSFPADDTVIVQRMAVEIELTARIAENNSARGVPVRAVLQRGVIVDGDSGIRRAEILIALHLQGAALDARPAEIVVVAFKDQHPGAAFDQRDVIARVGLHKVGFNGCFPVF